ncbi:MAG: class I SAM-dependent methyltransferase [Deltaproteobacteria bacterium]|nr:class I SAM-dependent methyltransferase [Deltaproteobacteria bacterium]
MLWNNQAYRPLETLIYDNIIAPAVEEISDKTAEKLAASLAPGAKVLDVGCGGGQLAVQLAKLRADLIINGLDLSPQQVKRARKRAVLAGVRAEFFQGSALDLPFKSETYDLVYSIASIKHWPDYMAGLRECLRLVKPGGLLIVVEVDKDCPKETAAAFTSRWRLPGFMKSLALIFFRVFVARRSITLKVARQLAAALPAKKYDTALYAEDLCWIVAAEK